MTVVAYSLCTLNQVKQYLFNSTAGSTYDTLLEFLIDDMTVFIENECGNRRFFDDGSDIDDELHDGDDGSGKNMLFLNQWPINTDETILVEYRTGALSNPTWVELSADNYVVDADAGMIYLTGKLDTGKQNYRVTYQGGYTSIPKDLNLSCVKVVAKEFDKRRSQGATNESIGGGSVQWNEDIDPSALRIFNKYRRFR